MSLRRSTVQDRRLGIARRSDQARTTPTVRDVHVAVSALAVGRVVMVALAVNPVHVAVVRVALRADDGGVAAINTRRRPLGRVVRIDVDLH